MSDTQETDATWEKLCCSGESWYSIAEKVKSLSQRLERERDEAREQIKNLKLQLGLFEDGNIICEETLGEIRLLEERIGEALKELSSIHLWIDRNHPDGFIDSLTYLQNLDRVTDNWYDRFDKMERLKNK